MATDLSAATSPLPRRSRPTSETSAEIDGGEGGRTSEEQQKLRTGTSTEQTSLRGHKKKMANATG